MKLYLVSCCLVLSTMLTAQTGEKVILGTADNVYSNILKENRQVWVHVPDESSPDGTFEKQRFPVIYLLDGWKPNFSIVSSIVDELGGGSGNLAFPKMIVVGIPNTDRTRDLTPTHATLVPPGMDSMEASRSGGGEQFISFLEKELIPHIDSVYPTAPYKIFIGHSLGGLMTIYTLINHGKLFNAYVATDPSTFWDNRFVLKQAKGALAKKQFENTSLFLATANSMNSGVDTSIIGPIMRCNFLLRDYLNEHKNNKLTYGYKYYADYDHHSVAIHAAYDALRFIFDFYNYNFPFSAFFNPSYTSDHLLAEHYRMISQKMGYTVSPPEEFVNGLSYQLMSMSQFGRAQYFFQLNIDNHPESFNAYDSMGDLFEKKGDKQKAIEYYTKSLSLHETTDTRKKLDKLRENK
jgi:uncharacterized protein